MKLHKYRLKTQGQQTDQNKLVAGGGEYLFGENLILSRYIFGLKCGKNLVIASNFRNKRQLIPLVDLSSLPAKKISPERVFGEAKASHRFGACEYRSRGSSTRKGRG